LPGEGKLVGTLVSRSYPQVSVSTPCSLRATGPRARKVKKLVRNQPSLAGVGVQGAEKGNLEEKVLLS